MQQEAYPVGLTVDYPDRPLDRVTTAFRIFVAIPIMIVLGPCPGEKAGSGATTPPRPPWSGLAGCCSWGRC